MIEIENVTFGYAKGDTSLSEFSLSVRKGECILLCGESGCGKTTVTKLVNGLIPHYTEEGTLSGSVTAAGMPVADTPLYVLARRIGSVFQNPKSQFFNLDTDSELAFGLENQGMPPEEMERRLSDTVKSLKLERLVRRKIFSLSGGEKQLLAFASVCAMNPDIYVLDEPTANLDVEAIEMLHEQIAYLKAQGHTILIAEHRLYFLKDVIDRAVYIQGGRLKKMYTGQEFRRLSEAERISMGLRTISPPELHLPEVHLPEVREKEAAAGLEVRGLSCGYKKEPPVFELLSFSVRRGEVLAVTGRNGVGKTTLIRCLCGLVKERAGEVLLNGTPVRAKQRRRVSFCVMQDVNHQLFYDSVRNECEQAAARSDGGTDARGGARTAARDNGGINARGGARTAARDNGGTDARGGARTDAQGDGGTDARGGARIDAQGDGGTNARDSARTDACGNGGTNDRIEEVLADFGLLEFAGRHPMALSGGQKQRLAVATAMLSDKEVLIFDEPTSGLDYRHMKEVCHVVRSLAEKGHIVLVVSHDREFMQEACDRVLELK